MTLFRPARFSFFSKRFMVSLVAAVGLLASHNTLAAAAEDEENVESVSTLVPESAEDLALLEERVAKVVEQCRDATVCVQSGGGSGSGVIISEDGYVLTAGHVAVQPGRSVTFIFPDGSKARGKSLGINVGVDAGLMKITDKGKWPHVEVGDMEGVEPGAWVVAMGHPGGFDKERSVVARLGRVYRVRSSVIQTDCTIIGGDSGGPLFDLDGKVIGIHSRISNSLRQNFHVPISIYNNDWDRMAASEVWNRPTRRNNIREGGPYIGVTGQRGPEQGNGAALAQVQPNSPAAKGGLRSGDVVIELDRSPIASFGDLAQVVGNLKPGDRVPVKVKRGGEEVELEIVIGKAGE
ncbi:MAG: trypsin-like peptidase domain-containing protein [Planctomycetota bacterium]